MDLDNLNHMGAGQALAAQLEHHHPSDTKKVLVYGFDGVSYNPIAVDSLGNLLIVETGLTITSFTETVTSVGVSSVTIASLNTSRRYLWIQNHGSGFVRVSLGGSATVTSSIRLVPQVGVFVLEKFRFVGAVRAISESGTNEVGVYEGNG